MEAYFTWYPNGEPAKGTPESKYLMDKFLYTIDRYPALVERYREDPRGTVEWWEAEMAEPRSSTATPPSRAPGWPSTTKERQALPASRTTSSLFEMGAHPFLTLTVFIAMFERDHGPLEYQIAYGKAMTHLQVPPYPTSPPNVSSSKFLDSRRRPGACNARPTREGCRVATRPRRTSRGACSGRRPVSRDFGLGTLRCEPLCCARTAGPSSWASGPNPNRSRTRRSSG